MKKQTEVTKNIAVGTTANNVIMRMALIGKRVSLSTRGGVAGGNEIDGVTGGGKSGELQGEMLGEYEGATLGIVVSTVS